MTSSAAFEWDDVLWDRVWERTLDQVERHDIAVAVLRRRLPRRPAEARIALELARRWRRTAASLSVMYGLWSLFWGGIGWTSAATGGVATQVPLWCAGVGIAAIAGCLLFHRRLRRFVAQGPPA